MPTETHQAVEAVWRVESARLIAGLCRLVRDVGIAEELAQDALVVALEQWPEAGIPRNPGAWLMAAAKKRALDHLRRNKLLERKHEQLRIELESIERTAPAPGESGDYGDELLRLMFVACHPLLPRESRVALALRLLGGLSTEEIARAYFVPEPTVAQRIVRAKRTLSDHAVPFEIPPSSELPERLGSVLEVIYLIFNEGYAATSGDTWMRPTLCDEALRLGRILTALAPNEPEAHSLLALMELQASRFAARVDPSGDLILLLDQNRTLWDRRSIDRGFASLAKAESLNGGRGVYFYQAAIAACHARARTAGETDWKRIASLYTQLCEVFPSPVFELGMAVAIGMADGPEAGLARVDAISGAAALRGSPRVASVRADFLFRLERFQEARSEFLKALESTQNQSERRFLEKRVQECSINERPSRE